MRDSLLLLSLSKLSRTNLIIPKIVPPLPAKRERYTMWPSVSKHTGPKWADNTWAWAHVQPWWETARKHRCEAVRKPTLVHNSTYPGRQTDTHTPGCAKVGRGATTYPYEHSTRAQRWFCARGTLGMWRDNHAIMLVRCNWVLPVYPSTSRGWACTCAIPRCSALSYSASGTQPSGLVGAVRYWVQQSGVLHSQTGTTINVVETTCMWQ